MDSLLHFGAIFEGGHTETLRWWVFYACRVWLWTIFTFGAIFSVRHHHSQNNHYIGYRLYFRHHHSGHNLYLRQWSKIYVYTLLHIAKRYTLLMASHSLHGQKKIYYECSKYIHNICFDVSTFSQHYVPVKEDYWFRHPFFWRSNHPSRIHDFAAFFHIINYFQWGSWALPRMVSGFWQPSSVCIGPCIESSYALQSGRVLSAVLAVWKRSHCSLCDIGAVEYSTGLCSLLPCWSTLCGTRL